MDKIVLTRGREAIIDFGEGTIIQNDTHTKYEEIKVTEVDSDTATAVIIGGNRARLDNQLAISQDYRDVITVPCWDIFDDFVPVSYVPGTPPPTQIYLTPNTIQNFYFEEIIFGVHHTSRQYETYYVSRTGADGSWFRIDGKDTFIVQGMVYFKMDNHGRNIRISLSDSISSGDRVHTIMDFTHNYGSNMSDDGSPITDIEFDPDTATLTGLGDGLEDTVDLTPLRDGEGELLLASDIGSDLTLKEFEDIVKALPKAGNYSYNNSDDPDKLIHYVALRSANDTVVYETNGMSIASISIDDL